jgi:hypothetical protein
VAAVAHGNFPLMLAGRTEAAGLECVPNVAAFAVPAGLLNWHPATFRAPDAGAIGGAHRRALHRGRAAVLALGFRESGQACKGGGKFDLGEEAQVVIRDSFEKNLGLQA